MGNQVKPVRCLLASIGHGCRTCAVATCSLAGLWEMPGYVILNLYERLHLSEEFGYMVPITALQGCGNICGSGSSNGIPCHIQAGTAVHVDNYFDYLWVHRTPLPMGLHCQNPLFIGARLSNGTTDPNHRCNP